MIEAVIFDMDGVLADTEYYYENRRKNFLLENGIPIPEGNFIGSNEKAIWEAIVPNDPVRRQEMLMAYREYRKARPTPYGKLTDRRQGCCGIYAENTLKRGRPDRWPLFCCRELSGCGSG